MLFIFLQTAERLKPRLRLLTKEPCQLCDEAKLKILSLPKVQLDRFKLVSKRFL